MLDKFNLDGAIRKIADFPKPGIIFYDITSLLMDVKAFNFCIDTMYEKYKDKNLDAVIGLDARGFLFAAPLAYKLKLPLVLVRKKGKLPGECFHASYDLEYGTASIEIQKSDIIAGKRYLVVDDLVATGGTLKAVSEMLEKAGAELAEFFAIIGLSEFPYENKLKPYKIETLINY